MTASTPLPTPLAAPIVHPPRGRIAGAAVGAALGPRLSRLAGGDGIGRPNARWSRSRILWSTGWCGARSSAAPAAVIARAPRAAIDCNRAEDDIDPAVIEGGHRGAGQRPRARRARDRPRPDPEPRLSVAPPDRPRPSSRTGSPRPTGPIIARSSSSSMRWSSGSAAPCCSTAIRCRRRRAAFREIVIGDRHGRSAAPWVSAEAVQAGAGGGLRRRAQRPVCRRPHHRAARRARPRRPRAPGRSRPPLLSRRRPRRRRARLRSRRGAVRNARRAASATCCSAAPASPNAGRIEKGHPVTRTGWPRFR